MKFRLAFMLDLLTTDDMETECSYKMEKEPKQGRRWKKEEIFFLQHKTGDWGRDKALVRVTERWTGRRGDQQKGMMAALMGLNLWVMYGERWCFLRGKHSSCETCDQQDHIFVSIFHFEEPGCNNQKKPCHFLLIYQFISFVKFE